MKTNECEVVVVAAAGRNEAEKLAALRIIVTRWVRGRGERVQLEVF